MQVQQINHGAPLFPTECLNSLEEALSGTKRKCAFSSSSFDTASYAAGWKSPSDTLGPLWTSSPPDLAG